MSIVSVQPLGIELEVAPDQTVMAAAAAAGTDRRKRREQRDRKERGGL